MSKEKNILNACGHKNSERLDALKILPSAVCPACLLGRIKELERTLHQLREQKRSIISQLEQVELRNTERIKNLDERIEALERLLVCYRVRKNPSEALHRKLEKTKQALEGGR